MLIDKEKNQIRSFDDFKKLAAAKGKDFNENWLQAEYNLSVSVGQNSAAYHRFMSEKDTVTSYVQYQTAGDSKVRKEHDKLDGAIFNLSDKEAMKFWPPNGYGCRCEMIQYNRTPRPDQVMSGSTAMQMMDDENGTFSKSQFAINRGDLKEVFTKKQFYSDIKGLPAKLNDMTFEKYDLPKWNSFKSDLKKISIDKTITEDNVKELFKTVDNEKFMRYKDYFDRKVILSEKTFKSHTKGKYTTDKEIRHQLFPHIKNVINNPDEVWYNSPNKLSGKFQSRYIKFHNDMILVIDCEMTKNGLEILSWYQAKVDESVLRKGLKVK